MRLSALILVSAASAFAAPILPVTDTTSETIIKTAFGDGATEVLSFAKFDTTLGTLTGVTFSIDHIVLAGYFTVTSSGLAGAVESFSANVRVRQFASPVPSLGFPQYSNTLDDTEIAFYDDNFAPLTIPLSLAQNVATEVGIDNAVVVEDRDSIISSSFWSNYVGLGSVDLEFRNLAGIVQSGGAGSFDSTTVAADGIFTLTYTYTPAPIPEPSTYGLILGGLALAGAAIRRRRQTA